MGLTKREELYAKTYAATGDPKAAQAAAGYSGHYSNVRDMVLARPHVQARVEHIQAALLTDISDLALEVHQRILRTSQSETILLRAAELAYKYTLGRDMAADSAADRPASEMTLEQIEQALQRARSLRQALEPSGDIIDVEPAEIDLFS
jgi:hypothetical protein